MNDFELRRQLQNLATPREPGNDLWAGIAARIEAAGPRLAESDAKPPRNRSIWPFALAASLLLSVGVAALLIKPQPTADREALAVTTVPLSLQAAQFMQVSYDSAVSAAVGGERGESALQEGARPDLVAARTEIDAATLELTQALQQNPDSIYLLDLMRKTQERRLKLARLAVEMG